jgi:hypothetical protein
MIIAVRLATSLIPRSGAETQQYDNERLGNCILIVGQVVAVGNARL